MAVDELTQIKTALAELNERQAAARRPTIPAHGRPAPSQRELAELQALFSADRGLGTLGDVLTRRRDQRRASLLALEAQASKKAQASHPASAAAMAAGIEARRQALRLLAQPFTSTFATIEAPFLIWELPHPNLDIFRDSHIEPHGSWVKILLDTKSSPGGAQNTDFRFYFLWDNPSDYYAVVNASSSLVLSGQAVAWGSPGVLHGATASLYVNAYLSVVRWSGWGTDPNTGQSNDQTPYPIYDYQSANKSVVAFDAYGGDWFDDAQPGSADFDPQKPFEMIARLIAIPGHAITLFEVGLTISWWFHDGVDTVDNDDQSITLDLAYDPLGHMARCPMVDLEVLTPPA